MKELKKKDQAQSPNVDADTDINYDITKNVSEVKMLKMQFSGPENYIIYDYIQLIYSMFRLHYEVPN